MSDKQNKHMIQIDGYKPIEEMTPEERDNRFKSLYGLTYAEWCEKYKDDTVEKMDRDLDALIERLTKHS